MMWRVTDTRGKLIGEFSNRYAAAMCADRASGREPGTTLILLGRRSSLFVGARTGGVDVRVREITKDAA